MADLDTTKIGLAAQEFMEVLEKEYLHDDDIKEVEIVEVAMVAEVRYVDEDGAHVTETPTACTEDSRVYQTGLFEWAWSVAKDFGIPAFNGPDDLDDDDEPEPDA